MRLRVPAVVRLYENPLTYVIPWLPYIGIYQLTNRFPLREPVELPFTAIDNAIGFYPEFLPIYVMYLPFYWWTGFRSGSDNELNRYLYATYFQLALILPFFVLFPVHMPRELFYQPESYNWADTFWRWFDGPNNCMPSLHTANLLMMTQFNWSKRYRGLHVAIAAAIIASTVLVKQHYVVDLLAGAGVYFVSAWMLAQVEIEA